MSYWNPQTETPVRPDLDVARTNDQDSDLQGHVLYLKSYLFMRTVIGFIGIALPVTLLLGDLLFLKGGVLPRGSLSAYYHSGMRDVFVGTLSMTAIFLITYKVFEHHLDNTLSMLAGVAALGVALFPTGRPGASDAPLTGLQERLGETTVAAIHYSCAVVFIASLAVMSYYFGVREGNRSQRRDNRTARMSPQFWQRFHWGCATAIALAALFIVVTKWTGRLDNYSLLIGETVAVVAFGLSWLMKGLELEVLLSPVKVPSAAEDTTMAQTRGEADGGAAATPA